MAEEIDITARQTIEALMSPLARIMIDNDVGLSEAVEALKTALVSKAEEKFPDATNSQISLVTGVHRKDIKRLNSDAPRPAKASAAARVLSLWQSDPDFLQDGAPAPLTRTGPNGFDALVKRAKVDAAPATVLSMLKASGNVDVDGAFVSFVSATMVPKEHSERLKAAALTLAPHMETVAANLAGQSSQWDQALRYSHLSPEAAEKLESEAADMALDMLRKLNKLALELQTDSAGNTLFVAGTFTHISEQ